MKRLLFTIAGLAVAISLWADVVPVNKAKEAASQFLHKSSAQRARATSGKAVITEPEVRLCAVGEQSSYYIFNVGNNEGYIVVSGDDATEEILGYSDGGSINPDSMPCNMRMLFNMYTDQIKYLREHGITREQNHNVTRAASKSFHVDKTRLAKYDQGFPYNKFCPSLNDEENTATGCAATAMAELMFFYQWPSRTTGEIPAYISVEIDEEGKEIATYPIDAIPANTSIDWSNIISQYYTYYLSDILGTWLSNRLWDTDDQADAIANLMKMAGASVHMTYGESSSASNRNISYALKKYFGYESANLYLRESGDLTDEQWNKKLCLELENNGPILYYGNGDSGGHFFMLEGYKYDDDYYYDINFGWDGRKNGKFLLTLVKDEFKYPNYQAALLDVKPQSTLSPIEIPLKLTTDKLKANSTDIYERSSESRKFEGIQVLARFSNLSPIDTKFNYGLKFINDAIEDVFQSEEELELTSGYGIEGDLYFSSGNELTDGEYTIWGISKEVSTDTWLQNDNSDKEFIKALVWNDKLSLKFSDKIAALLRVSDFEQTNEEILRVGQPSEFSFVITNDASPTIYDGGLLVKDETTKEVIFIDKVQLNGISSRKIVFSFTPSKVGEHKLVILNKCWEEIEHQTVTAIAATASLDMLEVTGLTIKDGDLDKGLIDGTTLRGTISMKNNDEVIKKETITLWLKDKETDTKKSQPISVTIAPTSTVTYDFSFGNLINGHHYVLTATYKSGSEFFSSSELLCTTEGMGELEPDNDELVAYEYWFDGDVASRKSVSLNSNNAVIRASINTQGLSEGIHRFNFRLKRSDGMYSSVSTSTFMNLKSEKNACIVYWFDDDVDNTGRTVIADTEEEQEVALDLQDMDKFPYGFHLLNMRVATPGKSLGSVYTTRVMKMASGNPDKMEYWVDGDFAHRKRVTGSVASYDENYYVYTNPFDLSGVSPGLHRIYYRAASSKGVSNSAVSMTPVMVGGGSTSKLEYWFDDGIKNLNTLSAQTSGTGDKGSVIDHTLNLSGMSPGVHRLYYRGVNSSGATRTAVSMTPVMVNSMYEQNYQNARILGYSISVDDQEPQIREFGTPKEEIVMSHTLDARNLSSGSHKVKAKFWNSAYAGVSVDQQFKVVIPEPPTLQLTAQEKDGLVSLQFESVPNDLRYRIVRVDANGAKARVDGREGSSYPGLVEFVDNPTAGTYTYYVQTAYTDFKGEQQSLKSNEVSVTIAEKPEEVAKKYGNITGTIACDKNMPSYGLKVMFSDGVSVNVVGTLFMRTKIPEGTELTMTVEGDDTHEYEPATLTVKAGANVIALKGTLKEEYMPNNLANDLAICSALEQSVADGKDHHLKFTVENLSGYNKWTGYLRVKAIDRKWADKKDIDIATTTYEKKNFYIGETERIELSPSGNREVDVCIKKLNLKEETEFYLYLESVGKWLDSDDSEETKPLAIAVGADIANNPVVNTIEKTEQAGQNWDGEASERFAYLMLGLSSLIQGIDGNVGDLSDCYDAALDAAKSVTGKYTASEAISAVFEWLDGKTVLEAAYEPSFFNLSTTIYGIYRFTKSTVKPSYVQKYWTDILGASYDYASAQLVLHDLVVVGKAIKTKDPIEASLLSAELLYSLMYSGTAAPYASMMYAYMVVGKAMVSKLLEFASIMRGRYIVTRLKANKPYDGDEENRQNTAVDFKIVVKTKNLIGSSTINFQKADASSQIKSVSIKAAHKKGDVPAEFSYTPVFMKDCVMLKSDGRGITNSRSLDDQNEIKELYMEINWSNGRQTLIPLNDETDGINISFIGADPQGIDDFEKMKPLVYTVTLTTATGKDNMADELYLGTNKNRK